MVDMRWGAGWGQGVVDGVVGVGIAGFGLGGGVGTSSGEGTAVGLWHLQAVVGGSGRLLCWFQGCRSTVVEGRLLVALNGLHV